MRRKLSLSLLGIVISTLVNGQTALPYILTSESAFSNPSLNSLSKQLFGISLFEKGLAKTLDSITLSEGFIPDTLIQHTDTSLFYFRGYWRDFNPFNEDMDSVKLIVAETRRKNTVNGNAFFDTIWLFQIEGSWITAPPVDIVRNTFQKLHKRVSPYFSKSQYNRSYKQKIWNAEWYRYYLTDSLIWTANLTWQKSKSNWTTITMTFATKLKED